MIFEATSYFLYESPFGGHTLPVSIQYLIFRGQSAPSYHHVRKVSAKVVDHRLNTRLFGKKTTIVPEPQCTCKQEHAKVRGVGVSHPTICRSRRYNTRLVDNHLASRKSVN